MNINLNCLSVRLFEVMKDCKMYVDEEPNQGSLVVYPESSSQANSFYWEKWRNAFRIFAFSTIIYTTCWRELSPKDRAGAGVPHHPGQAAQPNPLCPTAQRPLPAEQRVQAAASRSVTGRETRILYLFNGIWKVVRIWSSKQTMKQTNKQTKGIEVKQILQFSSLF